MIGNRGVGVIFSCEAYIKVPIIAVSKFLQNEDHWLTIIRHAIKYYALRGRGRRGFVTNWRIQIMGSFAFPNFFYISAMIDGRGLRSSLHVKPVI